MSRSYNLIVGTFNTPELYTLAFNISPSTQQQQPETNGNEHEKDGQNYSLKVLKRHSAIGSHSWLALSASKQNLYATCWTDPPTIASYAVKNPSDIQLLNAAPTKSRSGYVCCSDTHVYSAGGATGEVFAIDQSDGSLTSSSGPAPVSNGSITPSDKSNNNKSSSATTISKDIRPVQLLDFVSDTASKQRDDGSTMDFGGLRHGAHSADLSPDGKLLYVADIGRNCIWTYAVGSVSTTATTSTTTDTNTNGERKVEKKDHATLIEKHISPRPHDGPRHVTPHPNGKIIYSLQEHSSMVDVFSVHAESHKLTHVQGVRIIPLGLPVDEFWADEVRLSSLAFDDNNIDKQDEGEKEKTRPKYLYASTRGLKPGRNGYVAIYALNEEGFIDGAEFVSSSPSSSSSSKGEQANDQDQGGLLCLHETVTSGGWANAIQPGPSFSFPSSFSSSSSLNGSGSGGASDKLVVEEREQEEKEYSALTDSQFGLVFILEWNGKTRKMREVATCDLTEFSRGSSFSSSIDGHGGGEQVDGKNGEIVGAATAVWL